MNIGVIYLLFNLPKFKLFLWITKKRDNQQSKLKHGKQKTHNEKGCYIRTKNVKLQNKFYLLYFERKILSFN